MIYFPTLSSETLTFTIPKHVHAWMNGILTDCKAQSGVNFLYRYLFLILYPSSYLAEKGEGWQTMFKAQDTKNIERSPLLFLITLFLD